MLATILLFCAISFDESPVLLQQIELDRNGFSCNTIDGVAGGITLLQRDRELLACYRLPTRPR